MPKTSTARVSELHEDPLAAMRLNAKLEIIAGAMEDLIDDSPALTATDDLFVAAVGSGDEERVLIYARREDARALIAWAQAYADAVAERKDAESAPFEVSW